ncbi:hypothetical protein QVD17_04728 [Tagetes erecta]|uniref:Uncharacterized protein n=1 Tax=Tagetes erecta TaxID=13708 RepID=A0AAD8PAW6_TARER|nr:hypothetical protein QVD17_04728 [Tagetes erecta]
MRSNLLLFLNSSSSEPHSMKLVLVAIGVSGDAVMALLLLFPLKKNLIEVQLRKMEFASPVVSPIVEYFLVPI